jgi:hypothetical protein
MDAIGMWTAKVFTPEFNKSGLERCQKKLTPETEVIARGRAEALLPLVSAGSKGRHGNRSVLLSIIRDILFFRGSFGWEQRCSLY